MLHPIGNDLIDRQAAHNRGRAAQARFLARVLCAEERAQLRSEDAGDAGFALLWSGKEAAYKALRKQFPGLVFHPGRWPITVDRLRCTSGVQIGHIAVGQHRLRLHWQHEQDWLHCVACADSGAANFDSAIAALGECLPADLLSARERAGIRREDSLAVRVLGRRLLAARGHSDLEILRARSPGYGEPPRLWRGDTLIDTLDISLSHDGRFVAVALARDPDALD